MKTKKHQRPTFQWNAHPLRPFPPTCMELLKAAQTLTLCPTDSWDASRFEWTILGSTTLKESWLPHSKFPANPLQDLRQTHYSGMRGGFQVSLPVLNRNTQSKQSIEVADISFFRDILCIKWNLQNGNVAHPSLYVYNCCCKKQDGSHEPGCSLVILK